MPAHALEASPHDTMRKITAQALTDVGKKRDHNEDAFAYDASLGVYVVCDGMGGHASGEVASRLTADLVIEFVGRYRGTSIQNLPYPTEKTGLSQPEALLSNAIQHANDRVFVEGMKDAKYEGMGTTLVAMLATGMELVVAHVGDSRVYRWADSELEQVTRDHSLLNHKIDVGELQTEEDIKGFKQGNVIVRAIGLKDYVAPEVQTVARRPGDLFLLCSDGLTDMVDDWSIQNAIEGHGDELDEAATSLIRMANDRGGKDNITVMFVRIDDAMAEVSGEPASGVEHTGEIARFPTDPGGFEAMDEMSYASTMQDAPAISAAQLDAFRQQRLAEGRPIGDPDAHLDAHAATAPAGMPTVRAPEHDPSDTLPLPVTRRGTRPPAPPSAAEVFRGGAPPVKVSVDESPDLDDDDEIGFDALEAFEETEPGVDKAAREALAPTRRGPAPVPDAQPRGDRARIQVASGSATAQRKRPPTDPRVAPPEPSIIVEDEPPSIVIDDSLFDG